MHLLGVGEILWDVFEQGEHLGGAVFNLCAHAARLGHRVSLVSAVGADARGAAALARTRALGISLDYIQTIPDRETGIVTVTVDSGGQPSYVIHRPAAYDFASLDAAAQARLAASPPDWICYGTLLSIDPGARELLGKVVRSFPGARRFYDINLRKDSFTPELVRSLLEFAGVIKLNDHEVRAIQQMFGTSEPTLERFCRSFAGRLGCEGVCVTRGEHGCALLLDGRYAEVPGYPVRVADAVGAGDAFSAALIHAIDQGLGPEEAGDFANRLGALVASRPGGVPEWSAAELEAMAKATKS